MRRIATWSVVLLLVLTTAGLGVGGWIYSEEMLPAPLPWDPEFDVEVLAVHPQEGRIVLDTDRGDLVELDLIGLRTERGLVVLQGDATPAGSGIERHGALLTGTWPEAGDLGRPEVSVYAGRPDDTLGLATDVVVVPGELGPMPAWRVEPVARADDTTWAVLVHGRGGDLHEPNRLLPLLGELGLPSLTISVRNDPDAAADPDGWGRFGDTEWEDLEAAVRYLRDVEGAERFVLVGYSQGAAIVLNHLRRSEHAWDVEAAVLISPLVSLNATLRQQAQLREISDPLIAPLVAAAQVVSRLRSGMVAGNLEHARDARELMTPMLLTHGDADTTVPIEPSRELAQARPDLVIYEEYPGVEHVREWNADRVRFEADLRAFLVNEVAAVEQLAAAS